jgi:hypothetical protein
VSIAPAALVQRPQAAAAPIAPRSAPRIDRAAAPGHAAGAALPALPVLRWVAVRLLVGVASAVLVLALAQLTVYLLVSLYAGITPYGPVA